jgi:hypothetical protein
MDTQPKPWEANTSYQLEDRVTICIEEKIIFVLRCIREGMRGAAAPTIRRGLGSHSSWNQYDIKQNNKVSDDECDWIVEKVISQTAGIP